MSYLLDTNILLFMAYAPKKLKRHIADILEDSENSLFFSAASIWEIVIKCALNKPDFDIKPEELRLGLFDAGCIELPIKSEHVLNVQQLPDKLHKDPFDRLLIAQASINKLALITSDEKIIGSANGFIEIIANR